MQEKKSVNWKEWLMGIFVILKKNGLLLGRWALAIIVFVGAPIYLGCRPQDYTPLVQILLSLFLFLLAYWIGYRQESELAAQRANDRWLPQAESVIFRLLTLHANVQRFSYATKSDCQTSECELPELKDEKMHAVRIKMEAECKASSRRLDDIAFQLDDAIEDWRRFIGANCAGDECGRIFEAIEQREAALLNELLRLQSQNEKQEGEANAHTGK